MLISFTLKFIRTFIFGLDQTTVKFVNSTSFVIIKSFDVSLCITQLCYQIRIDLVYIKAKSFFLFDFILFAETISVDSQLCTYLNLLKSEVTDLFQSFKSVSLFYLL